MSPDLELGSLSRGGAGAPRYELASAREDGDDAPIAFEVRDGGLRLEARGVTFYAPAPRPAAAARAAARPSCSPTCRCARPGELCALMGHSGAGKSTLLDRAAGRKLGGAPTRRRAARRALARAVRRRRGDRRASRPRARARDLPHARARARRMCSARRERRAVVASIVFCSAPLQRARPLPAEVPTVAETLGSPRACAPPRPSTRRRGARARPRARRARGASARRQLRGPAHRRGASATR